MSSEEPTRGNRVIAIFGRRGGGATVVVLLGAAKAAGARAQTLWDRVLIWLADDLFCLPIRSVPGFGALSAASFFQGSVPKENALVFRRMLILRALTAVAAALFIGWLDPFGLSADTDRFSRDAFYQFIAPKYPTPATDDAGQRSNEDTKPPAEPSVLLLTETDLIDRGETWPVSYGLHAEVLEELLNYEPKAVFVDIAFIDERSDDTWDELVETVCTYVEDGVPIYIAAPRFVHAYRLSSYLSADLQDVDALRTTRIQTLARAGAVPVAVPGGAFGRDGLVYPFGQTDKLVFSPAQDGQLRETEALKRQSYLGVDTPTRNIFSDYEELSATGDEVTSICGRQEDGASRPLNHFPRSSGVHDDRYFVDWQWGGETAKRFFLPSAACAIYLGERNRAGAAVLEDDWCGQQFALLPKDGSMEVYWRFRSRGEEQHSQTWQGPDFHIRNGMGRNEGPRSGLGQVCNHYNELSLLGRAWALFRGPKGGRQPSAEALSEEALLAPVPGPWMRETCPPFHYLTLSYLLPEGAGVMSRNREEIMAEAVTGKVVMYGVQLVAVWDKVVPPTHWPLPGVFFHAMAYDNLRSKDGAYIAEDRRTAVAGLSMSKAVYIFVLLLLALPVELYKTFVAELARILRDARAGPRLGAFAYVLGTWAMVNVFAVAVLVGACALLFLGFNLSPFNFSGILALIVTYISLDLLNNLRMLTRLSGHVEEADRRRMQRRGGGT